MNSNLVDMENTILYTLSTIPQIIAAVLALTGVFIVIRIDMLHKRIMGFGQRILDYHESLLRNNHSEIIYKKAFEEGNKGRLRKDRIVGSIRTDAEDYMIQQIEEIAQIETTLFDDGTIKEIPPKGFNNLVGRVKAVYNQKKEIINRLKILITSSVLGILFPLFCLMFTTMIKQSSCCVFIVLGVNFLLASFVVIYTGRLVLHSLDNSKWE